MWYKSILVLVEPYRHVHLLHFRRHNVASYHYKISCDNSYIRYDQLMKRMQYKKRQDSEMSLRAETGMMIGYVRIIELMIRREIGT
jgi:hypothetical protein